MDKVNKTLQKEIEEYKITLKCIREILDSFEFLKIYPKKFYSNALDNINELLEKHNI